jgi:hypothetical protein
MTSALRLFGGCSDALASDVFGCAGTRPPQLKAVQIGVLEAQQDYPERSFCLRQSCNTIEGL